MSILFVDEMVVKWDKREEFHEAWGKTMELYIESGFCKKTELWVDGFGSILMEPIVDWKYWCISEFENVAAVEEMHRVLANPDGEDYDTFMECERRLFECNVENTGKLRIMTDEYFLSSRYFD